MIMCIDWKVEMAHTPNSVRFFMDYVIHQPQTMQDISINSKSTEIDLHLTGRDVSILILVKYFKSLFELLLCISFLQ